MVGKYGKCWGLTDPIFSMDLGFGLTMFHVVSPVDSVKVVTKSFQNAGVERGLNSDPPQNNNMWMWTFKNWMLGI